MPSPRPTLLIALILLAGCTDRPSTGFDGEAALRYVHTQLAFGPRVPGSDGHRRAGDWIASEMRLRADTVIEQRWRHVTARGDTLPMHNILARFRPGVEERILYVAHWDTRPISENARASSDRQLPVPGANDGASGVAVLMALADVLKETPPEYGVDLLFVDGEDYGDFDSDTDVFIGSRWFADHLPSPDYQPLFGVVWDMVGDKDLRIFQEGHSLRRAPEVVARVWQTAADLGYEDYFVPQGKWTVKDDHIPLLDKGLRVIDVIDLDYEDEEGDNLHHTPRDLADQVSAQSLKIVGDVATALVRE